MGCPPVVVGLYAQALLKLIESHMAAGRIGLAADRHWQFRDWVCRKNDAAIRRLITCRMSAVVFRRLTG